MITRALSALFVSILFASLAMAQGMEPPPPEMKKLDFILGRWEGTGKMMTPGGAHESRVTEVVQLKAGGGALMFEGLGKTGTFGGADERIVHEALGVIHYDTAAREFRMRTYRGPRSADPKIEVGDKRIVWSFSDGRGNNIRYTITINDKGQWREIGEVARGGVEFQQFFEMTLDKVESSEANPER